ncbi:hypothetical protein PoB_006364800 [Plakobranchus ocellatus]|uniref:Secreted protein n=1 Tax=Plakobranchus ocellatus TaxID=259542 RepID=A0AAV4CZ18_9GAST|nr:hypothetical protein PoB_006364800 [Plakobranchus ocellatus]
MTSRARQLWLHACNLIARVRSHQTFSTMWRRLPCCALKWKQPTSQPIIHQLETLSFVLKSAGAFCRQYISATAWFEGGNKDKGKEGRS